MNPRQVLNQPVSKDDVAQAVRVIIRTGNVSPIVLSRYKIGYSKAVRIIAMLEGAGVVSPDGDEGRRIIIKNEQATINAALRRFNKGKRSK